MKTYVQSNSNGSTGTATTVTVTLNGNITVGNTLLVFLYGQTATVTSVTDNLSNTYTQDFSHTSSNGKKYAYSAPVTTGGSCTITWTFPSNTLPREIIVVEHRYLNATPFDQSVTVTGITAAGGATSGATASLTQNFELVVGLSALFNSSDATGTWTIDMENVIQEATGGTSYRFSYASRLNNSTNGQAVTVQSWSPTGSNYTLICLTYKYTPNDPFRRNNLRPAIFKPGLAR